MATGWAAEGAVQEQIDATVKDGILRAKSQMPQGPGLTHCAECSARYRRPDEPRFRESGCAWLARMGRTAILRGSAA
jgi:hypothetical protein